MPCPSRRGLFRILLSGRTGLPHFRLAAEALGEVILNGKASTEDYVNYGLLYHMRSRRDSQMALRYYRLAIAEGDRSGYCHRSGGRWTAICLL